MATVAESCKVRYDLLRIKRRCVECTKRLPKDWTKARCPTHHYKQLAKDQERRDDRRQLAARVTALEAEVARLFDVIKSSSAAPTKIPGAAGE